MKKKVSVKKVFMQVGIIFSAVGVLLLAVGMVIHTANASFMKNADTAQAEITDIERDYHYRKGRDGNDYDVWIEYTVDGKTYNSRINSYDSSMYVGKEIEVYYDPENPSDVRTDSKIITIVFAAIGGLFFALGMTFLAVAIIKGRKRKLLKQNGEALTGTIINVSMNTNVRINNRHPYKAECKVINPFDGEEYLYSSENITSDISHLIGMAVTVYVDKNNKSKYYVDMDELMERYNTENAIHDFR